MPQQHDYPDLPAPKPQLYTTEGKAFNDRCPKCGAQLEYLMSGGDTARVSDGSVMQAWCESCPYSEIF